MKTTRGTKQITTPTVIKTPKPKVRCEFCNREIFKANIDTHKSKCKSNPANQTSNDDLLVLTQKTANLEMKLAKFGSILDTSETIRDKIKIVVKSHISKWSKYPAQLSIGKDLIKYFDIKWDSVKDRKTIEQLK